LTIEEKFLPHATDSGGRIWDAGKVLSEYLLKEYRNKLPAMRVLELGSGTGIGGLTAAAAGASVLLTDGKKELVPVLENNVLLNAGVNILDCDAEVCELLWGDEHDINVVQGNGPYDLIIGSDLLYSPDVFPALLDSLEQLCTPEHTEVLLVFPQRFTEDIFLDEAMNRNLDLIAPVTEIEPGIFMARLKLQNFFGNLG